jgi:predicted Zn finger-like uncharacterized protein
LLWCRGGGGGGHGEVSQGGGDVIVSCPSCSAKYQYDESRFGESATKKLRCSKCSNVFEVHRPAGADPQAIPPNIVPARTVEETTKQFDAEKVKKAPDESELPQLAPLPINRRYSLAVILGASAGQIHAMTKPRVVLGRGAGSDIQLQDSEVSRKHAMLEIRGDDATLVDLGSTNGTFMDGVRIERATLSSHQEFSLGTTTLMFIVTELSETGVS